MKAKFVLTAGSAGLAGRPGRAAVEVGAGDPARRGVASGSIWIERSSAGATTAFLKFLLPAILTPR